MPISNLYNLINANNQNMSQFKGLTAAYSLLGGVPSIAGYTFLINQNNATNFGAGGDTQFNDENIYINTVNALYQGNARARSNLDEMFGKGETLNDRLNLIYDHIIPEAARSDEGRAYFLSQAEFYTARAAELGIEGDNGAAVVAFASLMKIAVAEDIGFGASINDLIDAVDDETAQIPEDGDIFTPIANALDDPTFTLTSGIDKLVGTSDGDFFDAPPAQNPSLGGLSNTLSSADSIDGGAGLDRLHAEITQEFVGGSGYAFTDIQPTITNVEEIDIEVRDYDGNNRKLATVRLDAKDISGHDEIGSYRSDGDLIIENLTTLDNDGKKRPTADITITMDHTDNSNSDNDAADLTALFDDNYLIPDTKTEIDPSTAVFRLLDQDAELWAIRLTSGNEMRTGQTVGDWRATQDWKQYATARGLDPATDVPERLQNINITGIDFLLNGERVTINITDLDTSSDNIINGARQPRFSGSHQEFLTDLQTRLDELIAEAVDEGRNEFATLLRRIELKPLSPSNDTTGLDDTPDPTESDTIPNIILAAGAGDRITAFELIQPGRLGEDLNVYNRVETTESSTTTIIFPPAVDIDLFKVGRGGDGGHLLVGGKSGNEGIEVFNVDVKGDGDQSSNLEYIDSTADALRTINIKTHADSIKTDGKGAVPSEQEMAAAVKAIADYAEATTNPAPTVQTYANAGVVGVTATNLDAANRKVAEVDRDKADTTAEIQALVIAGLTIRKGSGNGDDGHTISKNLKTINADAFLGDLTLGSDARFVNVDTITAQGGGDVQIKHRIDEAGDFTITTGDGNDTIHQTLKFDDGSYTGTKVEISTGAGNDIVTFNHIASTPNAVVKSLNDKGTVEVDAGAGKDTIDLRDALNETVVLKGTDFGTNTVKDFETGNDAGEGFDFLDFTAYLTSREDPAGEQAERPIGVTLDFNQDNTLTNTVAANEVAVVRMTADAQDPAETFAALNKEHVAALFNTTGGTAFGGDKMYGNLANDFAVRADYVGDALVGNAKAVFMVENAANVGRYKVFELTWSGRAGSEDDVEVAQLGILDFGDTGLTGLEEENLVGTSQYDGIA